MLQSHSIRLLIQYDPKRNQPIRRKENDAHPMRNAHPATRTPKQTTATNGKKDLTTDMRSTHCPLNRIRAPKLTTFHPKEPP